MNLDELESKAYYTIYHKDTKELPFGDRVFTTIGGLKNAFNRRSDFLLRRGRFEETIGFDNQDIYKITKLSVEVA